MENQIRKNFRKLITIAILSLIIIAGFILFTQNRINEKPYVILYGKDGEEIDKYNADTAWLNKNTYNSIDELKKAEADLIKNHILQINHSLNDTVYYSFKDTLFKQKIFVFKKKLAGNNLTVSINNDTLKKNKSLFLTVGSIKFSNLSNIKVATYSVNTKSKSIVIPEKKYENYNHYLFEISKPQIGINKIEITLLNNGVKEYFEYTFLVVK